MTDMTPQEILAAVEAALVEAARSVSLGQKQGHPERGITRQAVRGLDSIQQDDSMNRPIVSPGTPKGYAQ